jgi:Protein kinase domain
MVDVATEELLLLQSALAERYQIGRELGRGGMAHVYLARDLRHQRDVALKILRPELASGLGTDRFLREIRIEAALQHPHILPLHDSGTANGLLYYVMPFVAGESLRHRLAREKQLPLPDALRITREVADALSYAHSHNVVHRDIKPGNILLSAGHAVVADFGIARAITAAAGDQMTEAGIAVGTPEYMSPEQASGDNAVDGRTDTYALGCVLYEMLAGEPPFRARTVQATMARHRTDPPPSLRLIRPGLPPTVEDAIMTALEKIPADRFADAADFAQALEADGSYSKHRASRRPPLRNRAIPVLAVLSVLAALAVLYVRADRDPRLDPNRVMVFPLQELGLPPASEGSGEAVATYIGYALEGTAPLRWLEARDFVVESGASGPHVSLAVARRLSRAQRAGFYIDGTILTAHDSVTVVLRLHDVAGDSVLRRAGASSRSSEASPPQLGVRAVGELLPAILEPGRTIDLTPLVERKPKAIASFLQGERDYRSMRFASALGHYHQALAEDSALAVAALKGAAAANWLTRTGEDAALVGLALEREAYLPPRLALFARGLRDQLAGKADSAIAHLGRAVASDSNWSEGWMALGEVYYHLAPQKAAIDSLAEAAFLRARRADSTFTPPLFHLAEIALRRRNLQEAEHLLAELRRADPDSVYSRPLSLMHRCVRDGPERIEWGEAAERSPTEVLEVAQALSARGANPSCGLAGFQAVLSSSHVESHWGALLGLQSLLAALGQAAAVDSVLEKAQRGGLPGRGLYLLDGAAGAGFERQAGALARERGRKYDEMPGPNLWLLAEWEARFGTVEALDGIGEVLERRLASSGTRLDSLFSRIVAAHLARLRGDTASALTLLAGLTPNAAQGDLTWQPWEALAGERLALGEMLLAGGRPEEAEDVLAELDSHRAVVYILYLPASLELRARAADAAGRSDLAARHRQRLMTFRRALSPVPST